MSKVLQERLDKERDENDVPNRAVSIGMTSSGEIVYVIHEDNEAAQTARDRVKPSHPDITEWIDFDPINPGHDVLLDVPVAEKGSILDPTTPAEEPVTTESTLTPLGETEEEKKKRKKKEEEEEEQRRQEKEKSHERVERDTRAEYFEKGPTIFGG
jgi:outer membrane biosynthesis protein TonB